MLTSVGRAALAAAVIAGSIWRGDDERGRSIATTTNYHIHSLAGLKGYYHYAQRHRLLHTMLHRLESRPSSAEVEDSSLHAKTQVDS